MAEQEQIYDFRAARAVVRRRALLIASVGALLALVAGAATALRTDSYEATAVLLFRDPGLDPQIVGRPNLLGGEQIFDADTNVGLASLDAVADRVADVGKEGLDSAEVSDAVAVREGAGPELVEVSAEAADPERAALIANSYADAFVELRRETDREAVRVALEEAEAELDELSAVARDGPEGIELGGRIGDLRALELLQTGDAEVVDTASVSTASSSGSALRSAALGGFAGLILGLAAALLVERLDPRLRSREQIRAAFGAPLLASLPEWPRQPERNHDEPALEGLRTLAAGLRHAEAGRERRTVMLLPSSLGAGASSVALELAQVMAGDGSAVALIEADLREPRLAAAVGAEPTPGLRELLSGEAQPGEVCRELPPAAAGDAGSLTVVVAGGRAQAPSSLLGAPALGELVDRLAAGCELVLLDAPPLAVAPDAIPLLGVVDAVVVVCSCGEPAPPAVEVRRRLQELGAPLVGVVANRCPDI
jgi:Mrp family chromosome partitioning ATPase